MSTVAIPSHTESVSVGQAVAAVAVQALFMVVKNLLDKVLVAFADVSFHVRLWREVARFRVLIVLRRLEFIFTHKLVFAIDICVVADAGGGVGPGSVAGRIIHADAFVTCIQLETQVLMHVIRVDNTTSAYKLVAIAAILHELGSPAFCRVDF